MAADPRYHGLGAGLAVLLLATWTAAVAAQETQFASYADRLAPPEASYAGLSSHASGSPAVYSSDSVSSSAAQTSGVVGGAAIVFARPWMSGNVAFAQSVSDGSLASISTRDFDYDFVATPRAWIGYQDSYGCGVRARYWRFEANERLHSITDTGLLTEVTATTGVVGTSLVGSLTTATGDWLIAEQDLQLDVFDLEYTRRLNRDWGALTLAGGIRFVQYQQTYEVNIPPQYNLYLFSAFNLQGVGPSVAVETLLPTRWYGLSLYGAGRTSILLSQVDQRIRDTLGGDFGEEYTSANRDHVVGAFELELGIRWERQLAGGAALFAQGSVEGQLWTEMAHAQNDLANLGMLGIGAALGISR